MLIEMTRVKDEIIIKIFYHTIIKIYMQAEQILQDKSAFVVCKADAELTQGLKTSCSLG